MKKRYYKKPQRKLRVIPLGGLGEVGKNMMVFEYGNDIIIVDAGLMFPEDEMLGIDFVIPNISYLQQNKNKIRGLIITHGHEDHIGGIPYILPKISPPIYCTRLTKGLIKVKLEEFKTTRPYFNTIKPGDKIQLGCFKVEFFRVNHSIPDGVGLAIYTPVGILIHTGDFKFDASQGKEKNTDISKISQLSKKGVLALLSDSCNSEIPGNTPSEKLLEKTFNHIFEKAKGRIIVTSFASQISRIQQIIDVAAKKGKKVTVSGRSMVKNIDIATKLGYLKIPKKTLIRIQNIKKIPDNKIVILSTGSQGEAMSALARMSSGEHKHIKIKKGDTVVISASPIPGNERSITNVIDDLFREGANVIYDVKMQVHVSGHPCQEDLKMMISITKPKYFIPIHGEYHHLIHHGELAKSRGIEKDRILITENGNVIEFGQNYAKITSEKIPSGYVMVDGLGVGDVGNIVLRDRQAMAKDGIFVVILTIDKKTGELVTSPDIISRGFVYMRASEELINKTRKEAIRCLKARNSRYPSNWTFIKNKIRDDIGEFLYNQTQRRPMVLPVIIEV